MEVIKLKLIHKDIKAHDNTDLTLNKGDVLRWLDKGNMRDIEFIGESRNIGESNCYVLSDNGGRIRVNIHDEWHKGTLTVTEQHPTVDHNAPHSANDLNLEENAFWSEMDTYTRSIRNNAGDSHLPELSDYSSSVTDSSDSDSDFCEIYINSAMRVAHDSFQSLIAD